MRTSCTWCRTNLFRLLNFDIWYIRIVFLEFEGRYKKTLKLLLLMFLEFGKKRGEKRQRPFENHVRDPPKK
jgi:hypothetical protein